MGPAAGPQTERGQGQRLSRGGGPGPGAARTHVESRPRASACGGEAGRERETASWVGGRGAGRGGLGGYGTGEAAWHALPSRAEWEEDSEELLRRKTDRQTTITHGKSESPHRRPSGRPG